MIFNVGPSGLSPYPDFKFTVGSTDYTFDSTSQTSSVNNVYYFYRNGTNWEFYAKIKDCKGAGDRFIAEVYKAFYPGVDDIGSSIEASGDNGVIVRINIDVDGEPFERWLRNNPVPEER